jgi:hypothetical protein
MTALMASFAHGSSSTRYSHNPPHRIAPVACSFRVSLLRNDMGLLVGHDFLDPGRAHRVLFAGQGLGG